MNVPGLGSVSYREGLALASLCWFVWQACLLIHPGRSLRTLHRRPALFGRALFRISELRAWLRLGKDPGMAEMLQRHPLLPVMAERPYLNAAWPLAKRKSVVLGHYSLVGERGLQVLMFPPAGQLLLARLDEVQPGLRLVLDKPRWFVHEGEVALNLFSADRRLYSLLFSLSRNCTHQTVAYVGTMQGLGSADALDLYRTLTRDGEGLRPRDLLFAGFRMLCKEMDVDQILAVSDANSVRRSPFFEDPVQPTFAFDAAWRDYGGTDLGNGFFRISPELRQRDPADIPSRKRAQYRRRYELLRLLAARIADAARRQPAAAPAGSTALLPPRAAAGCPHV